MPELHGQLNLKKNPNFKQVQNIDGEDFENLIYIWEFLNNFNDFLNLPPFSLSELYASLNFHQICGEIENCQERIHTAFQQEKIDSSQEITNDPFQGYQWHQRCTMIEIREHGFNLINQIHQALINTIIKNLEVLNKNGDGANQIIQGGLSSSVAQTSRSTRQTDPSGNNAWTGQRNTQNQQSAANGNHAPEDHENGVLIHSLINLDESNKEKLWTELVRLLIIHADERLEIEIESMKDYNYMNELLRKFGGLSPQSYTFSLSYNEKVDILMFLVDSIHDLDNFRQFLNKRLEDKSNLFKQKNDLHAEIKKIEQEKNDFIQEQKQTNAEEQEKIKKKIEELNEQLLSATRVESRWINTKILDLKKELNQQEETIQRFEDRILKKHQKIDKIVEQYHSLNIKTSVQGVDQRGSEYWHFKDDNSKIYIKNSLNAYNFAKINDYQNQTKDIDMISQQIDNKNYQYVWQYLDDEEEFDELIESLNSKGILEKKLIENLKKIRSTLKLKKTKTQKQSDQNDIQNDNITMEEEKKSENKQQKSQNNDEKEDKDITVSEYDEDELKSDQILENHQNSKKSQNEDEKQSQNSQTNRHHLFESDDFEESIISSVWFSKQIPKKKKNEIGQNQGIYTRGRGRTSSMNELVPQPQYQINGGIYESKDINFKEVKTKLLEIEELYTNTMQSMNREWESIDEREKILKELQETEDIDDLFKIIQVIERGFCDPYQVTYKKIDKQDNQENSQDEEKEISQDQDLKEQQDVEMKDDENLDKSVLNQDEKEKSSKFCEQKGDLLIKRRKIQMFKFWPKHVLRQAWQKYISAGESGQNINTAYLAVQLLDKANQQFVVNQLKKQKQKIEKLGDNLNRVEQLQANIQGNRRLTQQEKTSANGAAVKSQYGRVTKPLMDYKKYFQSSSDDLEDEINEQSDNQKVKRNQKDNESNNKKIKNERSGRSRVLRGGYRKLNNEEDEDISGEESQEAEESDENDFYDEFNERSQNKLKSKQTLNKNNVLSNINTSQRILPNFNSRKSGRQVSKPSFKNLDNDLYEKYGYRKVENIGSRSDRAKLRNQKRGYDYDDEENSVSQNKIKSNHDSIAEDAIDMRDDEIAEMNQDHYYH